jgi:hypothetical protein
MKFCTDCGSKIEDTRFCTLCGAAAPDNIPQLEMPNMGIDNDIAEISDIMDIPAYEPPPPTQQTAVSIRERMTGGASEAGKGFSIASLIIGIIGLTVLSWWGAGLLTGAVGLVFGIVAMKQIAESGTGTSTGMSVAGIVLNALTLLTSIACVGICIAVIVMDEGGYL